MLISIQSIRIPAGFNGQYGLRPSAGRLPYEGMANSWDGQNSILSVVGPIATSPGALKLLTKSLLSTKPWLHDPLVHELPWRAEQEQLDTGKLSFGVLKHDGTVTPTPPVRRAIDIVAKTLEKLGHEVSFKILRSSGLSLTLSGLGLVADPFTRRTQQDLPQDVELRRWRACTRKFRPVR